MAKHQPRKFELKLDGISNEQISSHRDVLYAGYINKLNEIEERLATVDISKSNNNFSDFRSIKMDETYCYNGVVLHELYFGNLGGKGGKPKGKLADMIARDFGSYEQWLENFKACGMAARGWAILYLNPYDGKLHNYCLDTHNYNAPANCVPILVLDVYEHAYFVDFSTKRALYIDAFIKNIEWAAAEQRLERIDIEQIQKYAAS